MAIRVIKGKRYEPGARVRLTGAFLRSTGQIAGGEGQKVWTVRECGCRLCANGRFVLTDEISGSYDYTPEEIAADPHLRYRHINAANVVRVGVPDGSVDR
jgi:hypothetical protein